MPTRPTASFLGCRGCLESCGLSTGTGTPLSEPAAPRMLSLGVRCDDDCIVQRRAGFRGFGTEFGVFVWPGFATSFL